MADYRIIVVGCGSMAKAWVEYALQRPDAEIVALVDIQEASARAMAEKYGLKVPVFADVTAAAASVQANLVFDVTIPDVHKQVTLAAFETGCHVMGEKPMAASLEEAAEMVQAAGETGRFYAVMQNRRYLKNIRSFRSLISDGTIGKAGYIGADFFLGAHFGGFRDVMASPLILDMAIHTFDQARFLTGANPVSVYCHEFNPPGSWYEGNASAICIFEMSDGSVFCYRGSWCAEGAPTSWESSWRVTGSKGTALWDGHSRPYAEVVKPSEGTPFMNEYVRVEAPESGLEREGHFAGLDEMFEALGAGRPAETDCKDNIESMKMVFGALRSAATGQKIYL